jgi:exonuclease III
MIDDTPDPGVTTAPDEYPTPAPTILISWTEQLQAATVEWNILLNRQQPTEAPTTNRTDIHLSPENLRNNIPWGDSLQLKDSNTFQIYCQNANGIRLDQTGGEFVTMCELSLEVQADVIAITEHNLDTQKFSIHKCCHDACTRLLAHSSMIMASSSIEMINQYKPGGTLTISRGKITSRLIKSGSDDMGRWTYQTFSGKRSCNVTIITAYQVCDKAISQQESILRQLGESNPNPRKHFRLDLHKFLRQRRQEDDEIILTGDFNEARGDETDGISKLCSDFNLVDLMFSLHKYRTIATNARGKKRLDFALATPLAASTIVAGGYEPFNHQLASDH